MSFLKRLTKLKVKYFIIISCMLMLLGIVLPTFMRYHANVTANVVGYAKETRTSTYKIKFHNNEYELEANSTKSREVDNFYNITVEDEHNIIIKRVNNILYLNIDNGVDERIIDYSTLVKPFYYPLTLGAGLDKNFNPWRYFKGTLSDISVTIDQ